MFSVSNFLHVADPPTITQHPEELNGVVPGKPVTFTVQATGTGPLTYQWQWKPAGEGSRKEWQECNLKRFPGANSSTLTIPSIQKSNEGSYCCTISNPVGSQTHAQVKRVKKNNNSYTNCQKPKEGLHILHLFNSERSSIL